MEKVNNFFGNFGLIKDFWTDESLDESTRTYMKDLGRINEGGFGSCADLMKLYSIVLNKDINHLNIDSNTKIIDIKKMYKLLM